jgi:Holliday junction DNA helicase RuvA
MYAYFKGLLAYSSPLDIIIDIHGIGYRLHIPANLYGLLPAIGEPFEAHTSFVVRENSHALYGFSTPIERDLFEALLGVTGIGPKLALSLIGHLTVQELQHAVQQNDVKTISKVPGIGKKMAERLVIELRDKLASLLQFDPSMFAIKEKIDPKTLMVNDAMSALINLGYNQNIAQKAIKKTLEDSQDSIDLAALITSALKNV